MVEKLRFEYDDDQLSTIQIIGQALLKFGLKLEILDSVEPFQEFTEIVIQKDDTLPQEKP